MALLTVNVRTVFQPNLNLRESQQFLSQYGGGLLCRISTTFCSGICSMSESPVEYFSVVKRFRPPSRFICVFVDNPDKYLKHGNMPKNCIVLTLDDGYRCNYHKVFPILKKCTIPATIFISTEAINSNAVLWHDKLIYAIGHTNISEFKIPELSDEIYRMKSTKDRNDVFTDVCRLLKQCEESEREVSLVKLMKTLEINVEEIENINLMLTWDEIREMHSSGLISFGSHTLSHSILTKVSKEKAQKEIYDSKKDIEEHLGEKLSYFSYPNGQYNLTIENIVKSAGYECAFSTNGKIRNNRADYYTFGRKGFVSEPFVFFSLSVAGVLDLIRGFIQDFNKVHPWMISYSLQKVKSLFLPKFQKKTHILLCICDHFEPLWKDADDMRATLAPTLFKAAAPGSLHDDGEG